MIASIINGFLKGYSLENFIMTMHSKVYSVLEKIESLNQNWRYELCEEQAKEHSFGRIRSLEHKEVKLWAIPRTVGQMLKCLVLARNAKTILELGCSSGYSTLWLAMGAIATQGHVYTTEIFDEKVQLAQKHFQEAELDQHITIYQQDIIKTLQEWQHSAIDVLFMDADIANYIHYFDYLLPLLSEHAIVAIDNAISHENYLGKFYEKIVASKKFIMEILPIGDGLCILRKI